MSLVRLLNTKPAKAWKLLATLDIEDEIINLGLLSLELPDPDQHLHLQLDPPTDFVFFPKLPIELRLVIWCFIFPAPREVNISDGQHGVHCFIDRYSKQIRWRVEQPLPVGLFVCSESRAETLKHYCVFHQIQRASDIRIWKPICFNPARDKIFVYYYHVLRGPGSISLIEHLSSLKEEAPVHLTKILQLRVELVRPLSHYAWYMMVPRGIAPGSDVVSRFNIYNEFIFYFVGLRKISLTFEGESWDRAPALNAMTTFLERNKHKFEGEAAPEVVVEDWDGL